MGRGRSAVQRLLDGGQLEGTRAVMYTNTLRRQNFILFNVHMKFEAGSVKFCFSVVSSNADISCTKLLESTPNAGTRIV